MTGDDSTLRPIEPGAGWRALALGAAGLAAVLLPLSATGWLQVLGGEGEKPGWVTLLVLLGAAAGFSLTVGVGLFCGWAATHALDRIAGFGRVRGLGRAGRSFLLIGAGLGVGGLLVGALAGLFSAYGLHWLYRLLLWVPFGFACVVSLKGKDEPFPETPTRTEVFLAVLACLAGGIAGVLPTLPAERQPASLFLLLLCGVWLVLRGRAFRHRPPEADACATGGE